MTLKKNSHLQKHRAHPKTNSKGASLKDSKADLLMPQGESSLFSTMVNHIGDEVIVADKQARIMFANKAAMNGFGYAKKNLLYHRLTDFLEDKISLKQWQKTYFLKVKNKKKPVSYVIHRRAKDGKVRMIDMTVIHMPYNSKDYVLAVGRDITEQSTFQGKLKESEDRYRLLSEQAADGIVMCDPQGITVYANNAAGRMFKTTSTKLVGSHFESHFDKSAVPQIWQYFRKVKSGIPIIHKEFEFKNKKGKLVPAEFTASPIFRDKKLAQIQIIFRDISEKKEMEGLIRESERMKSFQHFIAGTTHEIQQPLKGLLDHSQGLIERYKDRNFEYIGYKEFKDIMKTLQTMNDQVKYCFDTTDRLNSLNRKKAKLEKGYCHTNQIIRDAVNMLKHSLEVSDIKLTLKLNARLPHVAIGALDLSQALNNVITNAIQSLPGDGGTVSIKTTYRKSENAVRIDCKDDGVGIPNEVLTRVFDPFFTTKPRGLEKNSGLGLYIVYSIIKAHEGNVFIKSDFRKGTLVTIVLPVYKPTKKKKCR